MHSMQPTVTDDLTAWCDNLSVTRLRCAKTAERVDVLFEAETLADSRHIVLYGAPIPLQGERGFDAAFVKLLWLFVEFMLKL